jgi:hypothetical protein
MLFFIAVIARILYSDPTMPVHGLGYVFVPRKTILDVETRIKVPPELASVRIVVRH